MSVEFQFSLFGQDTQTVAASKQIKSNKQKSEKQAATVEGIFFRNIIF